MTKISRQDTADTSQPPMNGPTAVPTPARPDQAPMALPRSSGRNVAWRIARLPGVSSAAPMPCSARAAIRNSEVGATAQSRDASANQMTPVTKIRLRPYLSPSEPASSSSPARVSVYAVTTHCSESMPTLKSRPMAGSAMPTTVASMDATADPSTVASRTHRPRAEA